MVGGRGKGSRREGGVREKDGVGGRGKESRREGGVRKKDGIEGEVRGPGGRVGLGRRMG